MLEGVFEGTEAHIFAFAPTQQSGIQFAVSRSMSYVSTTSSDQNIIITGTTYAFVLLSQAASRLTTSPCHGLMLWAGIPKNTSPWSQCCRCRGPVSCYQRMITPALSLIGNERLTICVSIQLVFSNFYIGIAIGALEFASAYTTKNTRAWPFGGDNKDTATDEFYVLERYGSFKAHLRAAEALADKAGLVIADIYTSHSEKRDITARQRGEAAEWVASVKVVATDVALQVTAGVFEVTGARATALKVGLDRYWRDVRTHTLHDPVAYKRRELGRYTLLDEVPEATWYT